MVDNKMFDKVYATIIKKIEEKLTDISKLKKIGYGINYETVKLLNLYIRYLESVKDSKYRYFHVNGLTDISNYLNKI